MAKTPKTEQKMEVELGSGNPVTPVAGKLTRIDRMKMEALAENILQLMSARTQPEATVAFSKIAFAYDALDTGEFLFSVEDLHNILKMTSPYVDVNTMTEARRFVSNFIKGF